MGVRYTHQAITTERQIEILKERGLLIDDVEQAIEVLDTISYFRLAGYWRHFEIDRTTHQFRGNSCFADIIDLYSFDKQLRALLFMAIQTIEVSVRTKIIKHFAHEFGAFWFMDENYSTNEVRFAANLSVIRKEVSRSHDDFIIEHFRKYSKPDLPPVWKTLEVVSMGTLSKLYSNFSDAAAKHAVAREFGLNHHKFLRSWLECLAVLRNCCAHHSRLLNRVFPVKPKMPERMPNTWITDFSFREQTLYPQLCYLVYWLNSITPNNTFVADFRQLLAEHQSVNTRFLGFPLNWEEEPLWQV
ncbi:Abi family protein [Parabacteroides sp.]